MIGDLAAVVATLGGPADVVAHDWGVAPAYLLAATRPELAGRLAVMEAPPIGEWVTGSPSWPASPASQETWFSLFHRVPGVPEALTLGREALYLD